MTANPTFTLDLATCTFCTAHGEVCRLVGESQPRPSMCRKCIELGLEMFGATGRGRSPTRPTPSVIQLASHGYACTFCGLRRGQVSFMMSGPGMFACDYCLTDMASILGVSA